MKSLVVEKTLKKWIILITIIYLRKPIKMKKIMMRKILILIHKLNIVVENELVNTTLDKI